MNYIWWLLIGLIAGLLAGQISKRSRLGLVGDLTIGMIGGYLGGFLFTLLGMMFFEAIFQMTVEDYLLGSLLTATAGAFVLLFLIRKFRKA